MNLYILALDQMKNECDDYPFEILGIYDSEDTVQTELETVRLTYPDIDKDNFYYFIMILNETYSL